MASEFDYKLMRLLESNPETSQREISRKLGISLGKVNYCLRALIKKRWVRPATFSISGKNAACMYLLTPRGVEEKARLTTRFLRMKMEEYEALGAEIELMHQEATAARKVTASRE